VLREVTGVTDQQPREPAEPRTQPVAPGRTGAGRGVLYIAFAKFYFMFAGLVIQVRLPAVLSRAAFGSYSLVANIASLVNNVLVTGTIQAVSRFAAQEPGKARRVQQAGLRMHVRLGLVIALGFIAAAPLVARLLHDTTKTGPLMLAGFIVGGYSFYAVFVGTANGLHQFHKQAGLDMTFATLRVAGLLGMAMPSDYATRLSAQEINDLISYLMSEARSSQPKTPVTGKPGNAGETQE